MNNNHKVYIVEDGVKRNAVMTDISTTIYEPSDVLDARIQIYEVWETTPDEQIRNDEMMVSGLAGYIPGLEDTPKG